MMNANAVAMIGGNAIRRAKAVYCGRAIGKAGMGETGRVGGNIRMAE
jgi:hypothetical protein